MASGERSPWTRKSARSVHGRGYRGSALPLSASTELVGGPRRSRVESKPLPESNPARDVCVISGVRPGRGDQTHGWLCSLAKWAGQPLRPDVPVGSRFGMYPAIEIDLHLDDVCPAHAPSCAAVRQLQARCS